MTEVAISLKNISKCFKRYRNPGDRLKEALLPGKVLADEFWALRNVSLQVLKGHTIGVVGRNGSGKSTLLQIIVGTLTPTIGEVNVKGRISALLELGSGFNPEFTGRQNVFFNGQLLGLTENQIINKFDEIASFADIGDFIDQPVKTYSSGMFIRLGFAVAISAEPDILVVDEALSVGDEAFQRKCFSRIQGIQDRGGTILFVSHSASSIVQLCDAGILMDRGEILLTHTPKFVVAKYQKMIYASSEQMDKIRQEIRAIKSLEIDDHIGEENIEEPPSPIVDTGEPPTSLPEFEEFNDSGMVPSNTIWYPSRGARISDISISTLDSQYVNHLIGRRDYIYSYTVHFTKSTYKVRFGMLIKTISGFELGGASLYGVSKSLNRIEAGQTVVVKFKFKCLLHPGVYFTNAGVVGTVDDHLTYLARGIDVYMFRVQPCSESCGTAVVDLMVEPSLKIIDGLPIKEAENSEMEVQII